jgi:hypothetical protein
MEKEKIFYEFYNYFQNNFGDKFNKLIESPPMNWLHNEAELLNIVRTAFLNFCEENELKLSEDVLTVIILFSVGIFDDFNKNR